MTSLADEELVLLTSYFNLSNGRRQDSADTFRVDPNLSSASSPTGTAALYIVTEASGGAHMGPRARRMAADTISREYATNGQDPPARRLKSALMTAHREVLEEFEGHVAVGVSVIAVEHNDVYLAQVSPAQVYVLHDGNLHSNSPDPGGLSPFARSIGSNRTPVVTLARDEIAEGDVLALGSSWFEREADPDQIRRCFEFGSADDISAGLFELCEDAEARDVTAIVIEAVRESELQHHRDDEDDPGSLLEQVDMAVQALAGVGRMIVAELRPDPAERAERENGRARARRQEPEDSDTEEDLGTGAPQFDLSDEDEEPAPTPRQRSRFWGSTARRRPERDQEHPTDDVPGVDMDAWNEDPFATREVPAVSADSPPAADSQVADPWNPEKTTTYDLGDLHVAPARPTEQPPRRREQATEEVPALPPEAWADAVDAESTQAARADVAPAPVVQPDPEAHVDSWNDEPDPEAAAEPERQIRFPRRRPRRPFMQRPEPDAVDEQPDEAETPNRAQAEIDEVNSRLHDDLDMSEVLPPVQGFADAGTEPSRIYATSRDIQAVNRRPRRFAGMGKPEDPGRTSRVIRPAVDLDARRPVGRPAPNAVIWFAAAVVCVFAVLAAALVIKHLGNHGTVATNPYPAHVRHDLTLARTARTFDRQTHDLTLANQDLSLAKQYGASHKTVASLRASIAATSDIVYGIERVAAPVSVGKFQQPNEIANGQTNLYVLDPGKGALSSVPVTTTAAPTQIVAAGEVDDDITIGKLTHVATAQDTALVLDENNVLVRDNAGTKSATPLQKATSTQQTAAMINSGNDVYLLDPHDSQIWRYQGAVTADNPTPAGFFPSGGPNLNKAVSFTMDDTDIYVLNSDRTVLKFDQTTARQQAFSLNLHVPLVHPVAVFTDVGLNYLWIADPGAGRIVQVDKNGNYIRSYASSNAAMDFKQLRSIAVAQDKHTLYALAGNQVFHFDVKS